LSTIDKRKKEVVKINLYPEIVEEIPGRVCVNKTEAFDALEKIRDILVYLQTLEIDESEEREINYFENLDSAIKGIEEAQKAIPNGTS
jgi:hypothetical protein